MSVLPRLRWFVWKEAEEALRALAPESIPAMDAELGRRLSNPPLVRAGDEVVLIGRQGDEEITAWEWAERLGTIAYEVTCALSPRLPRIYT